MKMSDAELLARIEREQDCCAFRWFDPRTG